MWFISVDNHRNLFTILSHIVISLNLDILIESFIFIDYTLKNYFKAYYCRQQKSECLPFNELLSKSEILKLPSVNRRRQETDFECMLIKLTLMILLFKST